MTILTHPQRKERRRKIAEAVRSGKEPAKVATAFGVSLETVRTCCREHDVECTTNGERMPVRTLEIVAALIRGEPCMDIARRVGVSHQRIYQIQESAEAAGIFSAVASRNGRTTH